MPLLSRLMKGQKQKIVDITKILGMWLNGSIKINRIHGYSYNKKSTLYMLCSTIYL